MGLDISILNTFILVADLESFSGAARKLGLTQPAVSSQIKTLEKEVGAVLFDRKPGKVVLTPAGRTAYSYSQKMLSDHREMIAGIPKTSGNVAGTLLMAASNIPGEYILPPLVVEYRRSYPDVEISLEITDSEGALEQVKNERSELGFVGSPVEDKDITSKAFSEDRLVLMAPPGHRLSKKNTVAIKDIIEEPFITRTHSSGTRKSFEALFSNRGIDIEKLNIVAELGSTQAVITAVKSGGGVSIISDKAAADPSEAGLVSAVNIAGEKLTRKFYVVFLKDRPLSMAADKFLKSCLDKR